MRLAIIFLAGCAITYEPDVGPLQHTPIDVDAGIGSDGAPAVGGPCGDSDPAGTVSFTQHIRPLLGKSPGGCMGCHGANATSGFSIGSYDALRRGGQESGLQIVVPGKPCESILAQKLGPAPPFGARMPYNGPPFYTAAELTLLRDWIAEGAHNN
jgi:hypothetical protein